MGFALGAGSILVSPLSATGRAEIAPAKRTTNHDELMLADLLGMTDDELNQVDPLAMNIIVLRGIPKYKDTKIEPYARTIDEWASQIGRGLKQQERYAADDPAWQHDPNLWRAGGMALALAGRNIGISYTAIPLDAGDVTQTFLPGLLETKRGTCSNMPVLYLAIAHRLGWPMHAVVSKDHMWVRWDAGKPGPRDGGSYFNLEATDVESTAAGGSYASMTDRQYAQQLMVPDIAIKCKSDFTSLTRRELLAIFLQTRAAYWAAHNEWYAADQDLCLARTLFPRNRDIFLFLHQAMAIRAGQILTERETSIHTNFFRTISDQTRQLLTAQE